MVDRFVLVVIAAGLLAARVTEFDVATPTGVGLDQPVQVGVKCREGRSLSRFPFPTIHHHFGAESGIKSILQYYYAYIYHSKTQDIYIQYSTI